jgi:predicted DNA-binding transcriptional regulator AlpA
MIEYIFDRDELAKKLKVPGSTVDFWRRRKDQPLPSKRIGKHVRYIWPEVQQWINLQNGQTS